VEWKSIRRKINPPVTTEGIIHVAGANIQSNPVLLINTNFCRIKEVIWNEGERKNTQEILIKINVISALNQLIGEVHRPGEILLKLKMRSITR
jgi:hypothetical protein